MLKATQLTKKSWILSKRGGRYGIMRQTEAGYAIMGGPFSGKYKTIAAIEKKVGDKVKFYESKIRTEIEEAFIEGYPVRHAEYYDVELNNNVYSYAKKEGSKDRYAAGYYAFFMNRDQWAGRFCPRIAMFEKYDFLGPFKTKMEMDHTVKIENNK